MASYKKFVLTDKGQLLLNKVIAGECDLVVTKAATGDGEPEEGEDLKIWTALKSQRQFFGISSFSRLDDKIRIRFVISNYDPGSGVGLEEEYRVQEIGVYAEDPEEGEILYAVSTADAGKGDFIPAYDETSPVTVTVNAYLVIGTGGNVLIRVSEDAYATAADIEELRQRTGDVEDTIGDLQKVAFTGKYSDLSNKPTASSLGAVSKSGDTMTGQLSLRPKTDEGGQICLKASEAHPEESGINLDQCSGLFRIFGEPSVDGSVTGVGTPLEIDVYGKTIKGGYTFYGNPRVSSLLVPNETDTVDVGSSVLRFRNVHANNLYLKGSGNYGSKLNFGDGDYVYLYEDTDDHLLIRADKGVKINGELDIGDMSVSGNITGGTWKHSDSSAGGVRWSSGVSLCPASKDNMTNLGTKTIPFDAVYGGVFFEDGIKIGDKYAVVKNGKKSNTGSGWVQNDITFGITYKDVPLISIQQANASIDSSIYLDSFFGDATNGYTGFRYWVYCKNSSWTYKTSWFAIGNTK